MNIDLEEYDHFESFQLQVCSSGPFNYVNRMLH